MAPFRFRLDRVLEWQVKVCHREEENVRLGQAAVAETEARIAHLQADCLAADHEAKSHKAIPAMDLKALGHFQRKSAQTGRMLAEQRQGRLRDLRERRQKLWGERQRLELLRKIRERAAGEYNQALERELEAVALDSHLSQWVQRGQAEG